MEKFTSIGQFRNVIHQVKHDAYFVGLDENDQPIHDYTRTLPTIEYRGTIKLHGTNASIAWNVDTQEYSFHSRERTLSETADNAGFWKWGQNHLQEIDDLFGIILDDYLDTQIESLVVFGEWAGTGIQRAVAISELEKMFVIFAAKLNGQWISVDVNGYSYTSIRIYNINNFPTFDIDIDFNKPELSQNKLIELTEQVEAECPVGRAFGVSGIGEGIVFAPIDTTLDYSKYVFKSKGEKHSSSKVKKLASVDVEAIKAVDDFVKYALTESRLEQGLHNLINEQQLPFEMSSLGSFIRWVNNDVWKEEADTIEANGLDRKKIGGPISNAARKWYITKFNQG